MTGPTLLACVAWAQAAALAALDRTGSPETAGGTLAADSGHGTRVACLTKAGRKKHLLSAIPVAAQPAAVSRDLPH